MKFQDKKLEKTHFALDILHKMSIIYSKLFSVSEGIAFYKRYFHKRLFMLYIKILLQLW